MLRVCTVIPPPRSLGVAEADSLWDCTNLRVRFLDGSDRLQARVMDAALEWTKHCAVRFEVTAASDADIRVTFNTVGSWSYVGMQARTIPARQPTLGLGWVNDATPDDEVRRVTLHEFGHALGLLHEHQHPRAAVPWNREAVYAYYQATQGWDAAMVQRNVFDVLPDARTHATAGFDRESIMLYPIPREMVTDDTFAVGLNTGLSTGDREFIHGLYPRPCACRGEL